MEGKKFFKSAVFVFLGGVLLIFLATWVVPRVLVLLTQAAPSKEYSIANSYLFGSPLLAAPNGEDKIRINAFLLDDNGRGVPNRRVEVTVQSKTGGGGGNAQLAEVQATTDSLGKSVWELVSTVAGQFIVTATVDGVAFPQQVTVVFR